MMDARRLSFVTEVTRGELRNARPQDVVTGVATDSRKLNRGELFVALVGERFDAHEFLTPDLGKMAGACLVESERVGGRLAGVPQILVNDSRKALGQLGAGYRRAFDLPVIGVTGSNGKTTTKRFLGAILGQRFAVCASPASFNNDIGVPLSLLQLDSGTGAAVFEIGTNHPGEIKPLAEMVSPQFGILTSIGRSHLEFFGSVEAVAHEKGFLGEVLPSDGVFFVNGDTPHLDRILPRVSARIVKVGFNTDNDWVIHNWSMERGGMPFSLRRSETTNDDHSFYLPALGRHHLVNASLAVVAGMELGLTDEELAAGVRACGAEKMRFERSEINGVTIFDDTYNANADSMGGALETLRTYPTRGRRVAVIGDMGELGEFSQEAHEEVGRVAARCGVDEIFAIGTWAAFVERGALAQGAPKVRTFEQADRALGSLFDALGEGDTVLLKASRASGLDQLAKNLRTALQERGEACREGEETDADGGRL